MFINYSVVLLKDLSTRMKSEVRSFTENMTKDSQKCNIQNVSWEIVLITAIIYLKH